MKLTVHGSHPGALLLTGVPWAPGALPAGAGLSLYSAAGAALPMWYEVRSRWSDGSARWVFVHARIDGEPEAESILRLQPDTNSTDPTPDPVHLTEGMVQLQDTCLAIDAEGCWRWQTPSGSMALAHSTAVIDGTPVAQTGPVDCTLVEASPIAPLVRVRQTADSGLCFDQLLRLEPGGRLHWRQRLSFLAPQRQSLESLTVQLTTTQDTAWTWPGLSSDASRRLLVTRPGYMRIDEGEETAGYPEARLASPTAEVWLEKGWQRAPFALTAGRQGCTVELYPAESEPLPVHSGTSLRHSLRLALGAETAVPLRVCLDAETACASGAFGPLMERTQLTCKRYPGYERAIEGCLNQGRQSRLEKTLGATRGGAAALQDEVAQDEEYFGLQHYGDWPMQLGAYGGERRMYADNEYDTPYAYWLQYVRTGETAYADVAEHSAVHMADLDCKATDGDMLFHGYRETADDHGLHRSSHGDLGHYWTDGLMLNWLLVGDLWAREAATGVVELLCNRFSGDGDDPIRQAFLGCERAVGWPLVALAGVAEITLEPEILRRMQAMVDYLARYTADPDRELEDANALGVRWWRICQQDGTKPFMLGVVMEGLERHHRLTQDPAAASALVRIARFLTHVMWVEGIEAFIYEWNAFNRGHREEVYPHYINMMVAPGLAYAYELTGERRFRDVATRSFHAALWTLLEPEGGKEIGMVGRTSSLMVARLHQWHQADEVLRGQRMRSSDGLPLRFAGTALQLHEDPRLLPTAGTPRFVAGALQADDDSCAVYTLRDRTATNHGRIAFTVTPDWDCPPHPGPVAQRAFLHLSDRQFTSSCVSIITFYTGLHVRFHDAERNYIEVLETSLQHWRAGEAHHIVVEWHGSGGGARLVVDGVEVACCQLSRHLSGAFQHLHLGHRPGNWRAHARITDLEFDLQ
jgi:hypothetical protein